jgi:enoyl-CoA hydratase
MDIIVNEHKVNAGKWVEIILTRPSKLNACTLEMSKACKEILQSASASEDTIGIMIAGAGDKAFCAGGDLRSLIEAEDPTLQADAFFDLEYDTILELKNFTKPFVAFWDGITMGGGAGLSLYGSHRIASEHLIFAMPENKIGFFPDVGTCTVFAAIPNEIGTYIALTGVHLNAYQALETNLATSYTPRAQQAALRAELLAADYRTSARSVIDDICARYNQPITGCGLNEHVQTIQRCFAFNSIEQILSALENDASDFARNALSLLQQCSPLSLELTLEHLRAVPALDFATAMRQEKQLAKKFIASGTFLRGIESVIINKRPAQW